ncbi:hypothetical protein PanWU01x14_150000, partial [Parasponia andersonii]
VAATNEQRLQPVEEAVQLLEQQIRGLSTLPTRHNGLESTLQTTQDSSHVATTIGQRLAPPSISQPRLNLYVFLNTVGSDQGGMAGQLIHGVRFVRRNTSEFNRLNVESTKKIYLHFISVQFYLSLVYLKSLMFLH